MVNETGHTTTRTFSLTVRNLLFQLTPADSVIFESTDETGHRRGGRVALPGPRRVKNQIQVKNSESKSKGGGDVASLE